MDVFFLTISLLLCVLVLVCLYRGVYGPTVLDRIIAVGAIGTKTTAILLLMGMIYGRVEMFVDIALAYALLNFIATSGPQNSLESEKVYCQAQNTLRKEEFHKC